MLGFVVGGMQVLGAVREAEACLVSGHALGSCRRVGYEKA